MAGWILVERQRMLCTFMINIDIDMCIYIVKGSLAEKLPIYERHPSKVK